jgi:hypothetical protein
MTERHTHRPSPALAVAFLALFVGLGGVALAATSIDGTTIKPGSEPGNRLAPNSVTGKQVKESTLHTVSRAKAAGALTGLVTVQSNATDNPPGSRDYAVASCPAGLHVIGGYVTTSGTGVEQSIHLEGPISQDGAWIGYVNNTSTTIDDSFTVSAICAHVTYGPATLTP